MENSHRIDIPTFVETVPRHKKPIPDEGDGSFEKS